MIVYTSALVNELLEKERSKCIMPLPAYITRLTEITFTCGCGTEDTRRAEQLYKQGGICKGCVRKNRVEKIKLTNLERYGVEFPMQSKEVQDKRRQNYLDTIGVAAPSQLEDIKQVIRQVLKERRGARQGGGDGLEMTGV